MERQKAVIASAALAGSLMTGGLAYALAGGALTGRQDNVGKLQPTTTLLAPVAAEVTTPEARTPITAPAAAGAIEAAPATAPPATVSKASPAARSGDDDHEYEEHEHEYEADDDD